MSDNYAGRSVLEEIKELLEKNLEYTQEIHKRVNSVYRHIFWQRVWHFVRVLIFTAVVLAGLIYLPPLIQKTLAPYQQILKELSGQDKTFKKLFDQFQNFQKGLTDEKQNQIDVK